MSNVKRKDSKNRNLRNGESQRKDGRYVYKYTDIYGKPQFIYSWKLVPTDKTPAGKRDDISLREKEAQIKKDLNDGIDTVGGKMTVCQLFDKKNSQRKNIKRATEKGRQYLMNALKNDPLGMRAIDTVKQSDAKEWAIRMSEKGYAYKTIDNYKRSLKASFYMAIQDDCIRKNPFEFKLSDVLEDDTEQKVILTSEQEERLLAFMETDKSRMSAFERYFTKEKALHEEVYNSYYRLSADPHVCEQILKEFGVDFVHGHIINGHVPVRQKDGENPVKADGKLYVIDGGLSKAYQAKTGIAGYTLIFNSHYLALAQHHDYISHPLSKPELDDMPTLQITQKMDKRILVSDTDAGKKLSQRIEELRILVKAYENGSFVERAISVYPKTIPSLHMETMEIVR